MQWSEICELSNSQFQRLVGVKRPTFDKMVETILFQNRQRLNNRGRPSSISTENQLLIMLMYYREYRTFFHIGIAYRISEAQCWRIVRKMETALLKSSLFHLPGKKQLARSETAWEVVLIVRWRKPDRTAKKKQRKYYSGKKKRHTLKTQVLMDKKTRIIICTAQAKGRAHDFRLFKESRTAIHPSIKSLTDSGYQGIQKIHHNAVKPIKRTKKKPLTKQDKVHNHKVGSQRVALEHTIRKLKIFKIMAAPYRNRRKRFGLRMNLIAAIYNFEL